MRKAILIVILGIGLVALPSPGSAQGFLPTSFDVPFDLPGGPVKLKPSFYVGYEFAPSGTVFNVSTDGNPAPFTSPFNFTLNIPLDGAWFGVTLPVPVTENFDLMLQGWILSPTNNTVVRDRYYTHTPGGLEYGPSHDCWYLDASAFYKLSPAVSVIGGIRYHVIDSHLEQVSPFQPNVRIYNSQVDVTAWSVVPYFGIQSNYVDASKSLTVRLIGMPCLPGAIRYAEHSPVRNSRLRIDIEGTLNPYSGYFLELFGEYAWNFMPNASLGIFGRAEWANASGKSNLDQHWRIRFLVSQDYYNFGFHRSSYTVGGSIKIEFNIL
jgi:hypothetical protein